MDTPSWFKRVEAARTPEEVATLVRDYFESRPHLAALPPECAPPKSYSPKDIQECAYRLAAYLGHDERYTRTVHQIAEMMNRATARLVELKAL